MPESEATTIQPTLYRHTVRPEWGRAILAWERGPRRAYQFEEGSVRVFRKGYYELMTEVDEPVDTVARVVPELERALGRSEAKETPGRSAPSMSFSDQVRAFRILFDGGFEGGWIGAHRGRGAARRLKRHRDPAVADANVRLSTDVIRDSLERGTPTRVVDASIEVLSCTDLVTAAQARPLRELPQSSHESYARALYQVLYADGPYAGRLKRLIQVLSPKRRRQSLSWQLVTALPALVHPASHLYVRTATIRRQAAWMAPRLDLSNAPAGFQYARVLDMTRVVERKLRQSGMAPADLWDIADFMALTLRPSTKNLLQH